jgi:cellulose synthase/poly-beta-1,6-N-acetylglucosamine synthase-like glycosyltransferase
MAAMTDALIWLCLSFVLLGMVPTLATFAQFLSVGLHGIWNHYPKCQDLTPRVAFVLPAWNEADVLARSIDSLMSIDYPPGHGASMSSTMPAPITRRELMRLKMAQYPGSVVPSAAREGRPGQGAHAQSRHQEILREDWAEAVMIMDADVLFEP